MLPYNPIAQRALIGSLAVADWLGAGIHELDSECTYLFSSLDADADERISWEDMVGCAPAQHLVAVTKRARAIVWLWTHQK